jgi:hypothetical protein
LGIADDDIPYIVGESRVTMKYEPEPLDDGIPF